MLIDTDLPKFSPKFPLPTELIKFLRQNGYLLSNAVAKIVFWPNQKRIDFFINPDNILPNLLVLLAI